MEEELPSSLNELKRYINKYRKLKSFVVEQKGKQEQKQKEIENIMSELRNQLTKAKKNGRVLGRSPQGEATNL